mmetsp:Transcript_26973/g.47607  ORF Transcript_26973/g.47607 Transcript_26973/m.47607 type:complete len:454 (-) Transcript_26973:506-1867(-)
MSTIVTVKGVNFLELDGSLSPRWGDGHYPRLSRVLSDPEIVSIRLFQIDFSRLDQSFVTLLGTVLKSRIWERVYMACCKGVMPCSCVKGILQTRQLEIYGSTLNFMPALGKALARNATPIECIRLRTRLQEEHTMPLAEGLKSSTRLKKLYLTCIFSDEGSAHLLSSGLAENQHLELLSLYGCELQNEQSMESMLNVLQNHPSLVTLELRDNNTSGAGALASLVRHTRALENLDLYLPPNTSQEAQLTRLNMESLSIALCENKSLKSLALANNALQTQDILWLSIALRRNKILQRLNLQGNLITDEGVQALANALPEMSLKELCLWNNPFTARGAQALLEGLRHQNTILQSITTFSRYPCTADIQYFTHLNRAGRHLLREEDHYQDLALDESMSTADYFYNNYAGNRGNKGRVPLALWPFVLGRVNEQRWSKRETASVLYTLLKEGPAVITSR